MKKLFLGTLAAIILLAFSGCDNPEDNKSDGNKNNDNKLSNLTIRNESSFVLTDVKFSGFIFATSGNDLPVSTQAVKKLTQNDLNKAGYITFVRKDIGISLRTEAISVGNEDLNFTFLDSTIVEEVGNSSNKKQLGQIILLPLISLEVNNYSIKKDEIINAGESILNSSKQIEFIIKNIGTGKLIFTGMEPIRINDTVNVFSVIQPSVSEINSGGSISFKISFKPLSDIEYTSLVTVNSNNPEGGFSFNIKGIGRNYYLGGAGPGGGVIFFAEGNQFKECSNRIGNYGYSWADVLSGARVYNGGGFTDWRLPNKEELDLVYRNIRIYGNMFSDHEYWSSTEASSDTAWVQVFSDGYQFAALKTASINYFFVRSFSIN